MKKSFTYKCPFGRSVVQADSQKALDAKVRNHNWYAHGPAPIVICQR